MTAIIDQTGEYWHRVGWNAALDAIRDGLLARSPGQTDGTTLVCQSIWEGLVEPLYDRTEEREKTAPHPGGVAPFPSTEVLRICGIEFDFWVESDDEAPTLNTRVSPGADVACGGQHRITLHPVELGALIGVLNQLAREI